jgi:hypothetical protein
VQTTLAINGSYSRILHSFYCKHVRAPLLASLSIARQHHQRHGHRPGTLGSVASYPREEPNTEGRRSGGLQDSFAIHFWARQRHGSIYFWRGCCWAHTMSTSYSRPPESRVVFHDRSGANVVSGSLWLAFSSCSSPLAEILKYRYYFSFSLCERRH